MNVWSKLVTAVRGGINELGENVADDQALRILDQEIRDADEDLKKTRETLAAMIARQKMADGTIKDLTGKIEEYEGYAMKALNQNDEGLTLEVAGKIAALEKERRDEAARLSEISESVTSLRRSVGQAEGNIKRLRQQIDTIRATESVQKAQMTVARRQGNGQARLQTALESLERIKRRQEHTAAEIQVAQVLDNETRIDNLETKLKAAGIIVDEVSPESILARLKEKAVQEESVTE